jgi:hypothetical protein
MWAREQSYVYLKQYIQCRNNTPWPMAVPQAHDRARWTLHHLGGLGSSWDLRRSDCTYYYPQWTNNEPTDPRVS